jgi:hypothetical protein
MVTPQPGRQRWLSGLAAVVALGSASTGALAAPAEVVPRPPVRMLVELAPLSTAVATRGERLQTHLAPAAAARIKAASDRLLAAESNDPRAIDALARQAAVSLLPAVAPAADIEVVAFLVLLQASRDMDRDLHEIMDQVKALSLVKQQVRSQLTEVETVLKQRGEPTGTAAAEPPAATRRGAAPVAAAKARSPVLHIEYFRPPVPARLPEDLQRLPTAELQDWARQLHGQRDSLDALAEMSEMESLRLQMAMDRRSKFVQALSNLEKKMSDTADTVVQNLK